jgi:hypothetical protein
MAVDRAALAELEALERERSRRRGMADPVAFARSVGVTADAWQERVLRATVSRILLVCSRQAGKSTVAALCALHRAVYFPGSLILVIAPSWRQSQEVLRKVQTLMLELPVKMDLPTDSKTEVEFSNGSRIVSLPAGEAKIRGFSAVNLLVIDESGDVDDELYKAVVPMLIVSRGRLLVMGTPKGCRGFFYEAWERGGPGWLRVEAPWQQCPRFDPAEIVVQRQALGPLFPQEFECKFLRLAGGMVFSAFNESANCIDQLPKTEARWSYLLGMDFGFVDETAFVVMGWLPNDPVLYVVTSWQKSQMHANDIAKKIRELRATYPFTRIVGDVSGYGKGPAEEMASRFGIRVEAAPKMGKVGFSDQLNGAFAMGLVKVYRPGNVELVQDIIALPWNDERTEHRPGARNHLPDALLYGWRVSSTYLQSPLPAEPKTAEERIKAETAAHWARVEADRSRDWWDQGDGAVTDDPFEQ